MDCWSFHVAHESLDDECLLFNNTMDATKTPTADGYGLTSAAGQNDFGFQVPLTEELPAPSSFDSVAEFEAFVMSMPSLPVTMADPTVEITWDDEGQGCATVTGFTPTSVLAEYASGSLDAYEDSSHADHIKTVLAIDLASPTVDTWSAR
ncbi:MAG: hypothetical protein GY913_32995 [Proteobacteria bacterium]|nr:hypothetical protein [Pseudomonadota bacterium]